MAFAAALCRFHMVNDGKLVFDGFDDGLLFEEWRERQNERSQLRPPPRKRRQPQTDAERDHEDRPIDHVVRRLVEAA